MPRMITFRGSVRGADRVGPFHWSLRVITRSLLATSRLMAYGAGLLLLGGVTRQLSADEPVCVIPAIKQPKPPNVRWIQETSPGSSW
jgi:hypothetical protein